MRNKWIWLTAVLVLMNVGQAQALKEEQRQKVKDQIKRVKIWEMTRELDLSESQAQTLFPAQNSYEARKEELGREREAAEKELERLLNTKADRQRITAQLDRLRTIDREIGANEMEFRDKIKGILTLEQQARYRIFETRFKDQLRDMIRDVQEEEKRGARGREPDARDSLRAYKERRPAGEENQDRNRQQTEPERRETKPQRENKPSSGSDEKKSPERKSDEGKSDREKGSSGQRPSRR